MVRNNNTESAIENSNKKSIDVPNCEKGADNASRGRGRPTFVRTGQRGQPRKVFHQSIADIDSEENVYDSDDFYVTNATKHVLSPTILKL